MYCYGLLLIWITTVGITRYDYSRYDYGLLFYVLLGISMYSDILCIAMYHYFSTLHFYVLLGITTVCIGMVAVPRFKVSRALHALLTSGIMSASLFFGQALQPSHEVVSRLLAIWGILRLHDDSRVIHG